MSRNNLTKSYGQAAVNFAEVLQELTADRQVAEQQELHTPEILEVGDLQSDGHGLNFLVKLSEGWTRIMD